MSLIKNLPPLPVRRLARILAVVAIAMAAGHLLQTLAARKPAAMAAAKSNQPQEIVQLSAGSRVEPTVTVAKDLAPIPVANSEPGAVPLPLAPVAAQSCPIDLALDAQPAAMIGIVVFAPCQSQQRVVLRHAGLAVTGQIGQDGSLTTALPALVPTVRVEILFADGNTVDGTLDLPEAAELRRFGVQWQGADAFVVHGLQNGADYGQPGDISPINPGRPEAGSLAVLGDSSVEVPLMAQIYTFPSAPDQSAEVVIEAAVTTATCGQDLLAETISSGDGRVTVTDLTLAMPECSGIGDFLVLKNLASDMKIAAN